MHIYTSTNRTYKNFAIQIFIINSWKIIWVGIDVKNRVLIDGISTGNTTKADFYVKSVIVNMVVDKFLPQILLGSGTWQTTRFLKNWVRAEPSLRD